MLPIILVLLVATSALAAPSYTNVAQISQNDIRGKDNSLIGRALDIIDGGDVNVYILNIEQILNDLSNTPGGQAQALGQTVALLSELSTGRPGDSCAAANLINAYASGNPSSIRGALTGYIEQLVRNIDSIVRLVTNPDSVRYASGSRGGCPGEGRSYQFDKAWDSILASYANSPAVSIINEEFCTAKRLYCAFNARSNNVGAQITASALPPTVNVFKAATPALSTLLKTLTLGGNPGPAAEAAKQALLYGLGR